MINQERRTAKKHYRTYFLDRKQDRIDRVTQCSDNNDMYNKNKGFYRRVNVSQFSNPGRSKGNHQFEDQSFILNANNNSQNQERYKYRRLYDAYQRQFPIFSQFKGDNLESFIDYKKSYCSFATQFGLIDKVYLQSIFITRDINKEGYYEYFVRRNGQYYLEYIDDSIPVQGLKLEPIWGLSYSCPWQLLLLKAWIKQKRGISGVLHAQPFEFLYAFGLPGYAKKNIKKQLDFFKTQHSEAQIKKKKENRLAINKEQFHILGKTRDDQRIEQLGLIKNCVGYRITPIRPSKSLINHKHEQKTIYKIHSTVPSKWIGSLSLVKKHQLLNDYDFKKYGLNLEKQFLATEEEVLALFSKFYIARQYDQDYKNNANIYQDSYVIDDVQKDQALVYRLEILQDGVFNINIQFHEGSRRLDNLHKRWPYIKYFLARLVDKNKSGIKSVHSQSMMGAQFQPNLFRYQYYDIDFVKGFHRSSNRFLNIEKGQYLMYTKIEKLNQGATQIDYTINFSSSARFRQLNIVSNHMSVFEIRQLVDSTIFQYGKIHGEKYIRDHMQTIYLGNCFRQIGFGFIGLEIIDKIDPRQQKSLQKSQQKSKIIASKISSKIHDVEMGLRLFPGKMKKLKLAAYYYQEKGSRIASVKDSNQPVTMIASYDYPKVIVFQNPHYDFLLTEQFPEAQTVEIYSMKINGRKN